jgi:hypothetical protein
LPSDPRAAFAEQRSTEVPGAGLAKCPFGTMTTRRRRRERSDPRRQSLQPLLFRAYSRRPIQSTDRARAWARSASGGIPETGRDSCRLVAWGKQVPIVQGALGANDVDGCLGRRRNPFPRLSAPVRRPPEIALTGSSAGRSWSLGRCRQSRSRSMRRSASQRS